MYLLAETSEIASGNLNCDGEVGVTDIVMLQKWLLGSGNLPNWQNADLCQDVIYLTLYFSSVC